jgi:DNA-binding transcriptional LysR family regulator
MRNMNIGISHIRLLQELVGCRMVLSRAAGRLGISQPSASRKLRELEEAVSFPLVIRNGKRLVGLTPFATRLMDDVSNIESSMENIARLIEEQRAEAAVRLNVATTHAQARYFLPQIIGRFQAKWPKIEFHIHQDVPANILEMVLAGNVDMAVCTESMNNQPNLIIEEGYRWEHCLCVPDGHPLASGPIDLHRISSESVLTYTHGITGRQALQEAFDAACSALNVTIAAADTDVLKTFIRLVMGC